MISSVLSMKALKNFDRAGVRFARRIKDCGLLVFSAVAYTLDLPHTKFGSKY